MALRRGTSDGDPVATLIAIHGGDLMTNQQRHRPITQSFSNDIEPARDPFDSAAVCEQEKRNRIPEKEYDDRLESMQQFICELLIKNQQLRWLLDSSTNPQYQAPADDQSEDVARIQSRPAPIF